MKPFRHVFLVLLVLLGVAIRKPSVLFAEEGAEPGPLPRGVVLEAVECLEDSEQTYALFLPSGYTPHRVWPILYVFSPNGDGQRPVRLFREAAEKYGYIVAGSNNACNGPWPPIIEAIQAVAADTDARFSLHPERRYAAGFSGGARMAFTMANRHNLAIEGVIPCGAGFGQTRGCPEKTFVYALCGDEDPNYEELDDAIRKLGYPASKTVTFKEFKGGHDWPSERRLADAVGWMDRKYTEKVEKKMAGVLESARKALADQVYGRAFTQLNLYLGYASLPGREEAESMFEQLEKRAEDAWAQWNHALEECAFNRIDPLARGIQQRFAPHPVAGKVKAAHLALDETMPRHLCSRAAALAERGKALEAYRMYNKVIEVFPRSDYRVKAEEGLHALEKNPDAKILIEKDMRRQEARDGLKKAESLFGKKCYGEAWLAFGELLREHSGTEEARQAEKQRARIDQMAQSAWDRAKAEFQEARYPQALRTCGALQRMFEGLEVAEKAAGMVRTIRADGSIQTSLKEKKRSDASDGLWQIAVNFEEAGRGDLAEDYYRQILQDHPGSRHADECRKRLGLEEKLPE